jgi:xanthine dehydrogenase YagS FAD-binding subunit
VKAFEYANPTNEKDAVAALRVDGRIALPLAGGMDLVARMKDYVTSPDRVVNVKGFADTTIVATPDGGVKIGAGVKIADLAEHAQVTKLYPAVVAAAGEVGTPQIRNAGTVGGTKSASALLVLPPGGIRCYKKGGNAASRRRGKPVSRDLWQRRTASCASSLAVPFVAYGATFRVVGPNGERTIAASGFTMPTLQNVQKENVLADDEILTHVMLPALGNVRSGHYEVRYKESHDWPLAFATIVLTMNGNTIRSARVVLGAVAPIPWRSTDAEQALVGKPLNEATASAAGEAAVRAAKPLSRNGYKVQITKTAVKRAIMEIAGLKPVRLRA